LSRERGPEAPVTGLLASKKIERKIASPSLEKKIGGDKNARFGLVQGRNAGGFLDFVTFSKEKREGKSRG